MIERFLDHEQWLTTACCSWLIVLHHFARWAFSDTPSEFKAAARRRRRRRRQRLGRHLV
jgi:hypothetical protein